MKTRLTILILAGIAVVMLSERRPKADIDAVNHYRLVVLKHNRLVTACREEAEHTRQDSISAASLLSKLDNRPIPDQSEIATANAFQGCLVDGPQVPFPIEVNRTNFYGNESTMKMLGI